MPRTGLPDPESVVAERTVSPPPAPAATEGFAPAGARRTAFRILVTTEVDEYDRPISAEEAVAIEGLAVEAAAGDNFRGTARRAAKISVAEADIEEFEDLEDLIESLPAHEDMVNHDPEIETTANSDRVEEEQRNVRVRTFLYAASRENDNDFHLILGRDPSLFEEEDSEESPLYMTMELSGLPPASSSHFDQLRSARQAFKDYFDGNLPGTSYQFYDPPRPVNIEGSLFFDMSHAHGSRPGPRSLRADMPTIWEVHPISEIVFEE